MTSVLLPVITFGCFLAVYLRRRDRRERLTDRHQHPQRAARGISPRAMWDRVPTKRKQEIFRLWAFAFVGTPIVLLQAKTTWLIRGVAFFGFMGCVSLFTILFLWWEDEP